MSLIATIGCWHYLASLAYGHSTPVSASIFTLVAAVLYVSYKDICHPLEKEKATHSSIATWLPLSLHIQMFLTSPHHLVLMFPLQVERLERLVDLPTQSCPPL